MFRLASCFAVLCGLAASACPPALVQSAACYQQQAVSYAQPLSLTLVNPYVPTVQAYAYSYVPAPVQIQVQQPAPVQAPAPVQVPQAEVVPQPQAAVQQYVPQAVAVQQYAVPRVAVQSYASYSSYAVPLAVPVRHKVAVAVVAQHARVAVVRAPARVAVVNVAPRGQRVGILGRLAERRTAVRAVRAAR